MVRLEPGLSGQVAVYTHHLREFDPDLTVASTVICNKASQYSVA